MAHPKPYKRILGVLELTPITAIGLSLLLDLSERTIRDATRGLIRKKLITATIEYGITTYYLNPEHRNAR